MPASPASVSGEAALIVGVNWLGDSLLSLPAIQAYRQAHPSTRLVLLVKPPLAGLWTLPAALNEIWTVPDTPGDLWCAARRAAAARFTRAFILPHSFRSALVPFLARIPERIGMPGHSRDWMLTRIVPPPSVPGREHQAYEYLALFGLPEARLEPPRLIVSREQGAAALERLRGVAVPRVALLPGAARGPAKRWPAEYFSALGGRLKSALGYGIVVLGSAGERDLCARVAGAIGPATLDLAGQTSLPESAAILAQCALAVTNDSGGMHLAAAAGAPVLAIFGLTDPQKTGPLGARARVLQNSARRDRDLARHSAEAEASLRRITPEQALAAAGELLGH